nr:unnamed protein product [Spirometra erinaceieuropaei]
MGSPLSGLIAEAVMQRLERLVFSSYPPKFWARYVDDTFVIIKRSDVQDFKALLNSIFPDIQFAMEEEADNRLPFLDVQVTKLADGNIKTTVYRKAANTRRILHFRSNHPVGHKRSCVRTLFQRAQTHCSDDDDRKKEVKYLRALFEANGYPKSFIRKCLRKSHSGRSNEEKPKFWLSIPYVKNVSEATSRILKPFGIGVAHKPAPTIRQQIMRPKDPLPVTEQSAVVYSIPCQDCDARYVGETGKRLGTRLHEHQLAINRKDKLSLVYGHTLERNHCFAFEKASVIGRANDKMARLMLESWSSTGTLNRAIDLHPAYQALRARLESVQAGPMARMSRATRGRPPTLAERGEGADRMSRDRRGTPSHGRTREAGNTTPEKQRPISPPSDEGEANEHANAAATTVLCSTTESRSLVIKDPWYTESGNYTCCYTSSNWTGNANCSSSYIVFADKTELPPNLLRDTLPQPGGTPIFKGITYWQPAMLLSFRPANFFKRTNFSCLYFIRTTTRIPKIEWFFLHSNRELSVIPSHDPLNQHKISTEELSCPPELLDGLQGIYEEDAFYGIRNRCFRSVLTLNYRALGQDGEYVCQVTAQEGVEDADRTEVIVRGKTAYIHKNTISRRLKFDTVREELFACVRGSRFQLSFLEVLRCEHTSRYAPAIKLLLAAACACGIPTSIVVLLICFHKRGELNRQVLKKMRIRASGGASSANAAIREEDGTAGDRTRPKQVFPTGLRLPLLRPLHQLSLHERINRLADLVFLPARRLQIGNLLYGGCHSRIYRGSVSTVRFVDDASAPDNRISHGDLAARNVILAGDFTAKLCDFGLVRSYDDSPKKVSLDRLPIRWSAPELLANPPIWHPKSDVWSFGVLLWEIFSLGSTPYPTCATEEAVADRVLSGWRLTAPTFVPRQLESLFSHLLSSCWGAVGQPDSRPPFSELLLFLRQLLVLLKLPPARASNVATLANVQTTV